MRQFVHLVRPVANVVGPVLVRLTPSVVVDDQSPYLRRLMSARVLLIPGVILWMRAWGAICCPFVAEVGQLQWSWISHRTITDAPLAVSQVRLSPVAGLSQLVDHASIPVQRIRPPTRLPIVRCVDVTLPGLVITIGSFWSKRLWELATRLSVRERGPGGHLLVRVPLPVWSNTITAWLRPWGLWFQLGHLIPPQVCLQTVPRITPVLLAARSQLVRRVPRPPSVLAFVPLLRPTTAGVHLRPHEPSSPPPWFLPSVNPSPPVIVVTLVVRLRSTFGVGQLRRRVTRKEQGSRVRGASVTAPPHPVLLRVRLLVQVLLPRVAVRPIDEAWIHRLVPA